MSLNSYLNNNKENKKQKRKNKNKKRKKNNEKIKDFSLHISLPQQRIIQNPVKHL